MVQFAEDRGGVEYALKFFLDREAFLTEARLYSACGTSLQGASSAMSPPQSSASGLQSGDGPELPQRAARFLPRVEAVSDSGQDPLGSPLPPCIVMEKGESLQEWCNRAQPDLFTAVAVRCACCALWRMLYVARGGGVRERGSWGLESSAHAHCAGCSCAVPYDSATSRSNQQRVWLHRCCLTCQRGWRICMTRGMCTET